MFGLFGTGQVCGAQNDDTHIFEHIRLRSKIVEFRHGKPNVPQTHAWIVKVDPYKRSEEHTSELQSHSDLVCRLLLEKKKPTNSSRHSVSTLQHQPHRPTPATATSLGSTTA